MTTPHATFSLRFFSFLILLLFILVTNVTCDPDGYFHLTNAFNGPGFALDVSDPSSGELEISPIANSDGQYWQFVQAPEDPVRFRLQTKLLGGGHSLDVVNDGVNNIPVLSPTAFVTGQFWTIQKLDERSGLFKLYNNFTGSDKFLSVFSGQNQPTLSFQDTTGTQWNRTYLGSNNSGSTSSPPTTPSNTTSSDPRPGTINAGSSKMGRTCLVLLIFSCTIIVVSFL